MQTAIVFILIFGSLVFVHELGHLLLAKRAGILCREFAIGMGPKIFSWFRNETLYTLRLLPIGGYVKMAGEEPDSFSIKAGQQIGFVLDDDENITKIIVDNFEHYATAHVLEIKKWDLEDKLYITFYGSSDEEEVNYNVHEKALVCEGGIEVQIAPRNRQFGSKTVFQRIMAILAGPMMNFIFAFFLFIILGFSQGISVNESRLGQIADDSPALEAGLKEGDIVQSINGKSVATWNELVSEIQGFPNQKITLEIIRDGESLEKELTTIADESGEVGRIGVYPFLEKAPFRVIAASGQRVFEVSFLIFDGVSKLITGQFSLDALSGPVGIYTSTDEIVRTGYMTVIAWTAFLSVNLGVVNLLPLPALDGGRIIILLVELVRRKPLSREKEGVVHFIGFVLLMLLMLLVTWKDIQRLFH